ncbi:hypothetical protein GJ496_008161 [Pomphorhynchus laevis]|nr:hypothetical protein GJ496_008161 [Pomphorhynchus laevis]
MKNQQVFTPSTNIPLRECCIPAGPQGTSSTNFDWLLRNGGLWYVHVYQEFIKWRPNLFTIPKCNAAKAIAAKLTEFINEFVEESESCLSILKLISIFYQIILQKTSHRRTSDCRKVLERRLKWWDEEKFEELLEEAHFSQSRDSTTRGHLADNDVISTVRRIVHAGNIAQAAKLFRNRGSVNGILEPHDTVDGISVLKKLKQLHPESSPVNPEFVLNTPLVNVEKFNPCVFMEILCSYIIRSSKRYFCKRRCRAIRNDSSSMVWVVVRMFKGVNTTCRKFSTFCDNWTYLQRTVKTNKMQFKELEEIIFGSFLPDIVGGISEHAEFQKIAQLPVRWVGLGMRNPADDGEGHFHRSVEVPNNNILNSDIETSERTLSEMMKRFLKEIDECSRKSMEQVSQAANEKRKLILQHASWHGTSA